MITRRREAAGKRAGELSFVLSDATRDRMGDIIEPDGWELAWFRRNPIALFGHDSHFPIGKWANVRIDGDRLVADLEPAAPGTSERIDEIISLIKQDVLPATSVGFRPIRQEPIDPEAPHRGTRFLETELLEASIVAVPANPAALHLARSLHISEDTIRVAFGELPAQTPGGPRRGEFADPLTRTAPRAPPGRQSMTTQQPPIARQIADAQERLNTARDRLTELVAEPGHDATERDALSGEIDTLVDDLAGLERAERSLLPRQQAEATTIVRSSTVPATVARRPLGLAAIAGDQERATQCLVRAGVANLRAYIEHRALEDVLRQHYEGDEAVEIITRAAQPGASTTLAGWAAELVQTGVSGLLQQRDARRILPTLASRGTALQFGPDAGIIRIPSETASPSIAGSFVGEAQPIPVRRAGFTSIELRPHKVGVITRYSREIAMYSNPSIEGLVRSAIIRRTGAMLDTLLIDATALSATRPAGLLFGISALPPTAATPGSYGAILGDLKKLTAPFYAANAGNDLVMIVNPAQALDMMMAPGPGNSGFGWSDQFTSRLTIIESTVVAAGTVIMVEAEDFVSVQGVPEFQVSEEATLHIEDSTPLNISDTGTPNVVAAPVESMFQTNQIALRLILTTTWAMRRTGMVQYMTGVTWA